MSKITVESCIETTYEDGSYWINYRVGDKAGYDIFTPQSKEERNIAYLETAMNSANNLERYTNKKSINECSGLLKDFILECLQSENEMWYGDAEALIEEYGVTDIPAFVATIEEEVTRLNLTEYIVFGQDDLPLIIYGGVVTQFLFD